MEILAVYTDPKALETALATGARHLAATLDGFALVYRSGRDGGEPDGWAGFTCARDAQLASEQLTAFRKQIEQSERPVRGDGPSEPQRVWARAAGGVFGFPLQHAGTIRGVAVIGCPGPWPRIRNAEIESILRQIGLVLDHHAVSESSAEKADSSDELLDLSEQLLEKEVERIQQEQSFLRQEELRRGLVERMAIELRAPLNEIIQRVIAVLADEHENLSETGREALRSSLDEGNYLARMLQNILDLWRVQQDEMRIELQDVNIAEVLEEAIFNVRDQVKPHVSLEKKIAQPLPRIRTDLTKLSQILFHLLDNAAKFTSNGSIELGVSVDDGQLTCAVSDTGIGVAPSDQSQLFDEFFKVDRSPGSRHQGVGLGLTLAQALVAKLGGTVSLESEVGRGSRFTFTIPVTLV